MGLDIIAFKELKEVKHPLFDSNGELVDWENQWMPGASMEYSESIWPGRGAPIDPHSVYEWKECFYFRAGSYVGYGTWRKLLAAFADGKAFQELINFSDCEGVIGTEVAEKLYNDFKSYHRKAVKFSKELNDPDWWIGRYRDWERAFKLAKNNGAVSFE